jgi:two-component system, chemotaxis family, CheB/CheR fusion protein
LIATAFRPKSGQAYVLIRFQPTEGAASTQSPTTESHGSLMESAAEQIDELSIELNYTKENLNAAIEELETSNEELQATNEEMVASNEELQSTNEELHSVNEELYTVNAEFQKKIAELTKLNNDFDNLLSSTDIHTVFLDRQLNIRLFTPKAIDIFNFYHEDIGRKFDSFTNKLHLPSLTNDLNQVLETNQMIEREVVDQRGISFLMRLLPYVASGKSAGVVISLLDISARVEWELQIQNSNDRFERAIAGTRDGIWDWPNVREDIMWWSPLCYELLGYENTDFQSTHSNWMSLIHPEDRDRIKQTSVPLQKKCFVELHRSFEYRMLHKMGSYRWYQHRAICVHNDAGDLVSMTGSISDIQVRKELEDSLREQVRQRDDFLAILSHELRNPLGAVTNAVRLIDTQGHSQQQSQDAMGVIREQTHHMSRLMDDLLDVSRVTHNKLEMRMSEFDLTEIAHEVIASVKSRAESHGIELRYVPKDSTIRVIADRDRIFQCQVNLVGNAIKFTPRGGFIEYSLRLEDGFACIVVKDSGVGMSKELSERIFELFAQGENEPRVGDSGIGVGLALVRSIAELHNGTVSAHSDGLGKGSTFEMRIPLITQSASIVAASPVNELSDERSYESTKNANATKRVLIIDDLAEGRSMLAQILSLEGYEVVEAENGLGGYQLATEEKFDVALIDLGLPDMSGHEVARRLRIHNGHPMSLIALTGYGQEKDLSESRDAGFHHHLTKPVDLERLMILLEETRSSSTPYSNERMGSGPSPH